MAGSLRGLLGASLMLGLLLGTAGDPAAQQSAGGQPPTFRTGVNFVKVDVIVTDAAGRPALDLRQDDFQVTENGKPQTIETFKLVKLDGGVAAALDGPPTPIRTDSDEELEAARDDVRLFAIFLDDYHVRRLNSLRVRDQLSTFVENELGPSDMIGVMAPLQPVSSMRMTRNRAAVAQAVRAFVGRKYDYTPRNEIERQYTRQPAEAVEQIRSQVSLTAIRGLIAHLGSLKEGRKALILVSEGFISALPPELTYRVAEAGVDSGLTGGSGFFGFANMQKDLQEVYDAANRNNVAIYAVDPRGLAVSEFDIEQSVQGQADREFLSATRDTLRTLSEQTDGRAVVNRNDLGAAMQQVVRDTSGYYLLGYNSTQTVADGKFHEIKVSVKRPGVQVRARKGYWALTAEDTARAVAPPAAAPSRAVEAALASISQPADARVIRTWIGMSRGDNGKTRITFVWEPVPRTPGSRAAAESDSPSRVSLVALAPDGAPYFRGAVPDGAAANSPGAASRASRVTFEANPGRLQLRVSVEGFSTRQLDAETRELAVPDLGVSQTSLGTPAVLRARTLPEYQQIKADPQAIPIVAREFSKTDRLLVRVPAYGPGGAVPTLGVRLLNRSGQTMREMMAASSGAPGVQQIEVPLAGLAPGDYLIEIKAPGDGGDATEIIGFRVTS